MQTKSKGLIKVLITTMLLAITTIAMGIIAMAQTTITPTKYHYGTESVRPTTISYNQEDKYGLTISNSNGYRGMVVPIKVSEAGTLKVTINVTKLEKNTYFKIYTDAACTNSVSGFYESISVGKTSLTKYVSLSNKGTYYLRAETFVGTYNVPNFTNTFSVKLGQFTNSTKTISNKKTLYFYNSEQLVKYKASSTGYIRVKPDYNTGVYFYLYDSKKKSVSPSKWSCPYLKSSPYVTFAVKKGQTYYIKEKGNSVKLNSIYITETKVSEKSGSSIKKAVTVKRNKTVKGVITPRDTTSDWYKFTTTKTTNLRLYFNVATPSDIKLAVYNSKGKLIRIDYSTSVKLYNGKKSFTSNSKFAKGTYYVKLYRDGTKSNGYYSFKWL